MYLQDKIYKAIQKGLNEALDFSFDDEDNSILTKKKVSDDQIVRPFEDALWIKDNFVDLGLPSGTLWRKYNLGATCKDTDKSWYGNYYAWGEIEPKSVYNPETYKFYNDNNAIQYSSGDRLQPCDDAAYQTDNRLCIPTKKQIEELLDNTFQYSYCDEFYKGINNLFGWLFVSKKDSTKEIFIPAGGIKNKNKKRGIYEIAYISSANLSNSNVSMYCLKGNTSEQFPDLENDNARTNGYPIRPVYNK